MEENKDSIKPKIDDAYWFTLSETMLGKAHESRDEAAGKLQNLIVWLWGIYTASAAVGFTLSGKALPCWSTVLIAATSAFLILVYWGTVWVQMPLMVGFDPVSPTEIKDAYIRRVETKGRRLNITLLGSVLAAIMVSLALMTASVSKEQKSIAPGFVARIHSEDAGRMLAINGIVGKTEMVILRVRPVVSSEKSRESDVFKESFALLPMEKGRLETSIPLKTKFAELEVMLEWEDSTGMKIQLSKKVREEKKAKASN